MPRNILAAVAGILAAVVTVFIVQFIGHQVFPPPEGMDPNDTAAIAEYVANAPMVALLFPIISYFIGTLDGVIVAALIGTARTIVFGLIVAGFVLVAAISVIVTIPHPAWYVAAAFVSIIIAGGLGIAIGNTLQAKRSAEPA
ncbi:MAG: hypothetical protein AAF351_15865 [Pseudomonadota bacterium]